LPGPLSRELREAQRDRAGPTAAVPLRATDREPCLSARPSDDGADPVELVPALRPQPSDVRSEHLLGEAGGLPEGDSSNLSRAGPGELPRAAGRHDAMTATIGDPRQDFRSTDLMASLREVIRP